MLVQFSVENYRSFDKKATLNMTAGKGKELTEHIIPCDNLSLLKTAAIYGPNASGKSNLLKAFSFMKRFVVSSMKTMQSVDEIEVTPFLLNDESRLKPSTFEVVILIDKRIYRYGFSVNRKEVAEEWLYEKECKPNTKEICLFKRVKQGFEQRSPSFKEGQKRLDSLLGHNTLYISLLDRFNAAISKKIMQWFSGVNLSEDIFGLSDTIVLLEEDMLLKEWVDRFIRDADVGIKSINHKKEPLTEKMFSFINNLYDNLFDGNKKPPLASDVDRIKTTHSYYSLSDNTFKTVEFDMEAHESEGTKRLFSLAGPLFDSLKKGTVMIIDEIEASLHPFLIDIIINLFQSNESNVNGAQLIFTTHNTGLLTNERFRRDEVWFTEKDEMGATDLYPLSDFSPRKDASFDKEYLKGKYGALPFVNVNKFISMFKNIEESE
jgi:uncharacterized protein